MVSWLVGYQVAIVVAAAVTVYIISQLLRYREKRGVVPLLVVGVGAFVWILVKLAITFVRGTPDVFLATRLNHVGSALTAIGFLLFAIEYSGLEAPVSKRTAALLFAEPAVANVLIWVDLEYFWIPVGRNEATLSGIAWEWTTLGLAHTFFLNLVILVGISLLVRFAVQSAKLYRLQTAAILVGAAAPWFGYLVYWTEFTSVNLAPIGFAITGGAMAWAVVWAGFLNVAPIGRSAVVDDLYAGVLTMDADHQLVDINTYGRRLFEFDDGNSPIGRHVNDLFADNETVREMYWSLTETDGDEDFEVEFDDRYYEVDVTPLSNDTGQLIGRSLLVRDITDRKLRQNELENTNERLERFASVVSHDLRNPLNVIDGRVTLAREADDLDDHLASIEESTERMEAIIDDMLTLTRRGTDITFERVSLDAAGRDAWRHVDSREATLTVESNATIEGDRTRVVQLFENLFRNAIEHGGESVTLRVGSLAAEGDGEGIFVADDGPGIPVERRDDVLEDGFTTSAEGTGLGLTIVSDIVAAHGWELAITDSATGGARFELYCTETDKRTDPIVESGE